MTRPSDSPKARAALAASVNQLDQQLRSRLASVATLEEACRTFIDTVYEGLAQQLVLARSYVAMPLYRMPEVERRFALEMAQQRGAAGRLKSETAVLMLLASRGEEPSWNDRRNSVGHVALPLIDARFVESAPMLASLLRELGVELSWFDVPRDVLIRKLVGGFNGLFYVSDARTAHDDAGRLIIPAQDFVEQYGVKTVFGVGGSYLNGWMSTAIFFCRESLGQEVVAPISRLAATFKLATMGLIARGALFESG